jgi:uncharacterized repeat protein (TIGR02543 family)
MRSGYAFPGAAVLPALLATLILLLIGCQDPIGENRTPEQHTITFESQGGSEVEAVTAAAGTAVEKPADPAKADHSFQGWHSAAEGGVAYVWPHVLTESITMYARWTADTPPAPQQHTITFDSQGGTAVTAITEDEGTEVAKPANPTKAGHSFVDWHTAASGGTAYAWPHTLTASVTMYARWQADAPPPPVQFTITFESHGGSEVAAITANEGTAVEKPADPARDGYAFEGWHSAATGGTLCAWPHALSADATMHARWRENTQPPPTQYTITFESHGGSEVTAITANEGTAVEKPADPALNGYAFEGWHSAATGGAAYEWPHTLNADTTMHARWALIAYEIAYALNGGTNAPENPATYTIASETIALAAPARVGYAFGGWHDNEDLAGDAVAGIPAGSAGDKTFHAQWTAIPYAITYRLDGGTGAENSAYTIESSVITLPIPIKDGHIFGGWFENSGFSGAAATAIAPGSVGDKTFHARWLLDAPVDVSVWINEDGGILASNNDITISKSGAGGHARSFTVGVTSAYAGVQWHLSGVPIAGNTASVAINAADYAASKTYILGVMATKDGVPYSKDIRFTVVD